MVNHLYIYTYTYIHIHVYVPTCAMNFCSVAVSVLHCLLTLTDTARRQAVRRPHSPHLIFPVMFVYKYVCVCEVSLITSKFAFTTECKMISKENAVKENRVNGSLV